MKYDISEDLPSNVRLKIKNIQKTPPLDLFKTFSLFANKEEILLDFKKFDKEDIFGDISIVYLDDDGNPLMRTKQTEDLRNIIPKGGTAQAYIDEKGEVYSSYHSLEKVRIDGEEILQYEVNLDLTQEQLKFIDFDDYFSFSPHKKRDSITYYVADHKELWKFLNNIISKNKLISFRYDEQNRHAILLPHPNGSSILGIVGFLNEIEFVKKEEIETIKVEEEDIELDLEQEAFW
jgi:hypothetical protein